jgi:nucleotide-binding universal stress UspA family protein
MSSPPGNIERILCPTDFSELSLRAWHYARSFCEAYRAELHVLHVVDEGYQYWVAVGPEGVPLGPAPEELLNNADSRMEEFRRRFLAGLEIPVQTQVVFGRPFHEICSYASRHSIDLIVIATHGHSALTSVLLGSVTDRVVHRAPCPVLTVREKRSSQASQSEGASD